MLQIRRHEYSGDMNIVIFVSIDTLPFYAINMDIVSLFTDSSFLFLANLNVYCIDIVYFYQKKIYDQLILLDLWQASNNSRVYCIC